MAGKSANDLTIFEIFSRMDKALVIADNALFRLYSNLSVVAMRDKAFKIVQYMLRFLLIFNKNNLNLKQLQHLENLYLFLSNSRKYFRLGKSITTIRALYRQLSHQKKAAYGNLVNNCSLIERSAWSLFFAFDNIILFKRLLFQNTANTIIEKSFFGSWFVADIAKLVRTSYQYIETLNEVNDYKSQLIAVDGQVDETHVHSEQLNAREYELMKSIADIIVSSSFNPTVKGIYERYLNKEQLLVKDFIVMLSAVSTSLLFIRDNME